MISNMRTSAGLAALPPHTAESLRLSVRLLRQICGEAESRRNSKNRA